MYPVLITAGPVKIYTFTLAALLAFVLGFFIFWRRTKRELFETEKVLDVTLISFLASLTGGRIFELLREFVKGANSLSIAGEINFWVSIACGVAVFWFACQKLKLPFWILADLAIPALLTSFIILNLGHFAAGTSVGSQTGFFWGITFPGTGGARHPVQLISAGLAIIIFFLVLRLERKKYFAGFLFLVASLFFTSTSGLVEFLRETSLKLVNWGLASAAFLVAAFFFYRQSQREIRSDLKLVVLGVILAYFKIYRLLTSNLERKETGLWIFNSFGNLVLFLPKMARIVVINGAAKFIHR